MSACLRMHYPSGCVTAVTVILRLLFVYNAQSWLAQCLARAEVSWQTVTSDSMRSVWSPHTPTRNRTLPRPLHYCCYPTKKIVFNILLQFGNVSWPSLSSLPQPN